MLQKNKRRNTMPPNVSSSSSSSTHGFDHVPADLVASLGCHSPHDALLALANESERAASRLAEELALSLSSGGGGGGGGGSSSSSSSSSSNNNNNNNNNNNLVGGRHHHHHHAVDGSGIGNRAADAAAAAARRLPIPLPRSLRDAPRPSSSARPLPPDNRDSEVDDDDEGGGGGGVNPVVVVAVEPHSRALHRLNPSHPLTHAALAAESILSSLSKIASGG